MSAARFVEPYLTEPSIKLLISLLNANRKSLPIDQLRSDFHALHPGGRSQFEATLALMKTIGLLKQLGTEEIQLDQRFLEPGGGISVQSLALRLTEWLGTEGLTAEFVEALQFDDENGKVVLDNLRAPWRLNHIRLLLREIGVFLRDDVNVRHWTIATQYSERFLEAAKKEAFAITSKFPMSPEDLLRLKERQSLHGEQAEEWALSYEKQRLAKHPFFPLVRRISTTNVSAGYDIISFASVSSLSHDRFLEIKSCSDQLRFFWSAGEVEKAKEFGDKYILMLIDRRKLSDRNYRTIEIVDPYNYFFSAVPVEWSINSSEWMIERKNAM